MSNIVIPCPKCGKGLRIRDRKLLGRKGRCPQCKHAFVLEEPEEVELELADAATASSQAVPAIGTSAQWVPDTPAAPTSAQVAQPQQVATTAIPSELADLEAATAGDTGGTARLKELKRKNAKRRNVSIIAGAITAVAVVGVVFGAQGFLAKQKDGDTTPKGTDERIAERESLEATTQAVKAASPTKGKPIELLYIPAGARIVINIRPAELWKKGSLGEEVRFCLGPLATWAEAKLKEVCRYEPSQIEEALICVIPGRKGEPPEIATVVHLVEPMESKADFILEIQAERDESLGRVVYLNEEYAYMLKDMQTFAVAPSLRASEMVEATTRPQITAQGIEELIQQTDRERHLTVLFDTVDVRNFQDVLIPAEMNAFFDEFLDRFSDDEIETVAWSVHLDQNRFYSDILLRNQNIIRPPRLQKVMKKKIDLLPHDLLGAVEKMNPKELGKRQIIGRFPAMMKVFSMATVGGVGEKHDRYVQLTTSLASSRAAPNLALGALLAWDESTRTDFSKAAKPKTSDEPEKLPDLIADRLKLEIEIEFNRTPLQEAIAYIGEETHVTFVIDGDALKDKGMTKNMAQNQKLGKVPATRGLTAILGRYIAEGMCVVVDENKKVVTLTTKKFAEQKGMTPFKFGPDG